MESSDIPVLTKVYKPSPMLGADMSALIAQLKVALLPELSASLAAQLALEARRQVGASIEGVEDAFREAMQHVGKQHVLQIEQSVAGLLADQEAAMQTRLQSLSAAIIDQFTLMSEQSLQQSQAALTQAQTALQQAFVTEHQTQLETQFSQHALLQAQAFQQEFSLTVDAQREALKADIQQWVRDEVAGLTALWQQQTRQTIQDVLQTVRWVIDAPSSGSDATSHRDIDQFQS